MKQAPSRIHNYEEARTAEILDRPFIFWHAEWEEFHVLESASRSRNIKAKNFCIRRNEEIYRKKRLKEKRNA